MDEGLELVRAVHERHDGLRRNPWDEVECGHHYVRSMASWALLLALSGATANVATGSLGFAPRWSVDDFRCLFTAGTAWGGYSQRHIGGVLEASIRVDGGTFRLERLHLGTTHAEGPLVVQLDGIQVAARVHPSDGGVGEGELGATIELDVPLELATGATLSVRHG